MIAFLYRELYRKFRVMSPDPLLHEGKKRLCLGYYFCRLGLSRRQRAFIREKVLGLNDEDAALAARYSLSVAENTKQKIWAKPQVLTEFERSLETVLDVAMSAKPRK
jgi:hypothetical protein